MSSVEWPTERAGEVLKHAEMGFKEHWRTAAGLFLYDHSEPEGLTHALLQRYFDTYRITQRGLRISAEFHESEFYSNERSHWETRQRCNKPTAVFDIKEPQLLVRDKYVRTVGEPLGSFDATYKLRRVIEHPQEWAARLSADIGQKCDPVEWHA